MPETGPHAERVDPDSESPERRRARGRRIAMTVYYTMVVLVGGAAAVQITRQVMFPEHPPGATAAGAGAVAPASCREGLRALFTGLARAREAAAGSDGGEDAALARFRSALAPEWAFRDGVAAQCRPSADDAGTLDAIERLRYAEEHAVRREAGELAPLRRKVQATVDQLGR
jgi:hypothetical protein